MGLWSWFKNGVGHLIHDPHDNVNSGLIANPFLVKQDPNADHYQVGGQFGDTDGTTQRTSTELWAAADSDLVHVGVHPPDENQPSYALAAITNGLLRLVPAGQKFVVPRTDRHELGKVEINGPAYILENLDTAVDSFRDKLNADVWIIGGMAPPNRPMPAVIVYENIEVSDDLDELIETWYTLEKKPPHWTDARIAELVASWKSGESTAYVKAGYPIGQPAASLPSGVTRPAGVPPDSRYTAITVYDEFGVPIDLGWLLRHADMHAQDELFDNLVAPNVEVFRKDPVRGKLTRRDFIDIRDEYGLPYANRAFRRFDEASFPTLTSVFDKDEADLVLATEPESTGPSGIWLGPEVSAGTETIIQGVGLKDHLLAFLPTCASSTVVIKLRGYPGDYHRIIALPLEKWFPEQPNARGEDQAPKRYHLGCRVTPMVDGQGMMASVANAIRATFERAESDPDSPINLRPAEARAAARLWVCNWQVSPATYPYGGNQALYDALNPDDHPAMAEGMFAYPEDSLGFLLQSAIAAGVDVRVMPWFNILSDSVRGKNIEIARSINRFYDLNGYHTPSGPGSDAARTPRTTGGPNLSRGFAFIDDKTRNVGAHHQKATFIRNRYGDFAFVGGIDLEPGRWDTNMHLAPEERKPGRIDDLTHELVRKGWHDVHAMLEGPVVLDVAKNFMQRWNAFVADPPDATADYPVDLTGLTPIPALPDVPEEGVPDWPGPSSDLDVNAPIDPHITLDRGAEGIRPRHATQVCAVVRTIPQFIDAYDSFVKARPIPDNGEPLGELGCRAAFDQAIRNARDYIYLEDQYFVEPTLNQLLIDRLTHADPKQRLRRLFVIVPHILDDQEMVDAINHHYRRKHTLLIRQKVREMLAHDRSVDPTAVPQEDIDKIFTIAHLQHGDGTELYLHAKHMIVDDVWMVITSSNFSRRGMSFESEIGVTISDAEVEDGVRKSVRDQRIRLWAEHLRLDRSQWHRLLDPIAGAELLRQAVDNPNLPLIPFEINNPHIKFSYPAENHTEQHEMVYNVLGDPDGSTSFDVSTVETARAVMEELKNVI